MKSRKLAYLIGILLSLGYGFSCQGFIRYLEHSKSTWKDFYFVMSFGFVFLFPACLGAMTIYFASEEKKSSLGFQIFMPWVTVSLSLILSLIAGWEGTICLILALPVYLIMGSIGGVTTGILLKLTVGRKNLQFVSFSFLLISPFLSGFTENYLPLPSEIRTVDTQILIQASPVQVWSKIARIPKITEPQNSFFYYIGFPRPVEATLSYEGVGGIREAIFEKGLVFIETITEWKPNQKLRFSIQADPKSTPSTTLDPHVIVGGKFFDTLVGEYKLEPLDNNWTILHLHSQYRLSTNFNFYSRIWSDFLMRDIQMNILKVLKLRCENQKL